MGEKRSRSVAKAISWRVLATAATTLIAYLVTHEIAWAVSIGSIEFIAKIGLYYLHERVWSKISFGLAAHA